MRLKNVSKNNLPYEIQLSNIPYIGILGKVLLNFKSCLIFSVENLAFFERFLRHLILIKKIPASIVCSIPKVLQLITYSPNFSEKKPHFLAQNSAVL